MAEAGCERRRLVRAAIREIPDWPKPGIMFQVRGESAAPPPPPLRPPSPSPAPPFSGNPPTEAQALGPLRAMRFSGLGSN